MYYLRDDWGARPPKSVTRLTASGVTGGVVFHWPGTDVAVHGVDNVMKFLRSIQNYHMDKRGWADIAYQEAIDQDGNVYRLRGLRVRSAANGNVATNTANGAILLLVATGERPTQAMLEAARERVAKFREHFPQATAIKGHRQVRPDGTECPGDIVMKLIHEGFFEPGHSLLEEARSELEIVAKRRPRLRDRIADFLNRMPKR